jgi:predicted dehydrogenase
MSTQSITRRQFLNQTTATAAGIAAGTLALGRQAKAAPVGDKPVIAFMGCGGRNMFLIDEIVAHTKVDIAYLADPDGGRLDAGVKHVEKLTGKAPKGVGDFRRILDDKGVQALFIATPDHWHAPGTVLACQAGKDVYVEKPASHSVWEGRKMVEAARKYDRVVQLGTQTRSGQYTREAVEYIRSGKLGKVHHVRVLNMKKRDSIGHKPDASTPAGVDYDMWLGPAPKRQFNPNRFHYAWHWFWDYSGGDIINDGVHQIDAARFLIGQDFPKAVSSMGGQFSFDDDQETPDTQAATWEFDNMIMTFENLLWTPYMKKMPWELRDGDTYPNWQFDGMSIEVFGEKGVMFFERHGGGWQVFDESEKVIAQVNDHHPHIAHLLNFFECMQSRKKPNADIEEGHRSTILCQIANISYRLGGRRLQWDGKNEKFIGDEEADRYLKRTYRRPYVIPDTV